MGPDWADVQGMSFGAVLSLRGAGYIETRFIEGRSVMSNTTEARLTARGRERRMG